ncbi:MAG: glycosyl transferase group 1 [Bacteroidetes bacterium]|nr:glycosyl transferase group 1 [Bacteroidota bacterium]
MEMPKIKSWQDEEELLSHIRTFHLGLSPLLDNDFSRAKSAFKLKQYFAAGVPVLASPVGENKRILEHGKNGFFCETQEEFADKLGFFKAMDSASYRVFSKQASDTCRLFNLHNHQKTMLTHFAEKASG